MDPGLHVRSWWPCIGLKAKLQDFPGGLVVKNLSANARDTDLIIQAMGQLSPCTTATEHTGPGTCVLHGGKPPRVKPVQVESSLHLPKLEKACTQQQRPSTAKNKNK